MKHEYYVKWIYANGKTEKVKLRVRNLDQAIEYVMKINKQTSMTAQIIKERKVLWEY